MENLPIASMHHHTKFHVNTFSSLGVMSQKPKWGAPPLFNAAPLPLFSSGCFFKPCLYYSQKYPLLIHVGFRFVDTAQTESIAADPYYGGWGARPPKTAPGKMYTSLYYSARSPLSINISLYCIHCTQKASIAAEKT